MLFQKKISCLFFVIFFFCLKLFSQQLVIQKGNDAAINNIHYSPDGRNIVASCKAEKTVKIWERISGRLLNSIAANATDAYYTEDGKYLLTEEPDQYIRYDGKTYLTEPSLRFPRSTYSSLCFAYQGKLFAALNNNSGIVKGRTVLMYYSSEFIKPKHAKVLFIKMSPDNKHLFAFSEDSTLTIIDISHDSILYVRKLPQTVESCIISSAGKYAALHFTPSIFSGPLSQPDILIETSTGNEIKNSLKSILDISPDETSLLGIKKSCRNDDTISQISVSSDSILFQVATNIGGTKHACYSKNGKFAMLWEYNYLKIVDRNSGAIINKYPSDKMDSIVQNEAASNTLNFNDAADITSAAISPDNNHVAIGLITGTIAEISTNTAFQSADKMYEDPFSAIIDAQFVPQHPYIFTRSIDGYGILWNMENIGIEAANDLTFRNNSGTNDFNFLPGSWNKAVFNKDGSFFSTSSPAGFNLWQTETLKKINSEEQFGTADNNYFTVSPDAKFACTFDAEGLGTDTMRANVYVSSIDAKGNFKKIHTIPLFRFFQKTGYEEFITFDNLNFKGDSHHIIVSCSDEAVRKPFLFKAIQFSDSISILATSPYYTDDSFGTTHTTALHSSFSKKLNSYIISTDDTIYTINPASGKIIERIAILLKQPKLIESIDFDPATKYVFVKNNFDKKIYAVDVETGKPVYALNRKASPFAKEPGNDLNFSASSFSPDGKYLMTISEEKTNVSFWNAKTGDSICGFPENNNLLLNIVYSADGKYILCCLQNGSYEKREAVTGKLIYTFFLFRDHDYALVTNMGYYYVSSMHDVQYLDYRQNDKLYDFSQFDLEFNRPDKILEALGSKDTALINAYHKAWIKRITKSGFTEANLRPMHVPNVFLQNKDSLPEITSQKDISLHFRLSDTSKIVSYNIYVNDVPLNGVNGKRSLIVSGKLINDTITLTEGMNKIGIVCVNEHGAQSRQDIFYVNYQPSKKEVSKTWFIGIGINHYSQNGFLPNLSYCVKDIRDLATAFATKYDEMFVDTLLNANATRQNIIDVKKMLLQTNVEDRVIVSLSGHGLTYNDEFYFATPATDPANPTAEGISYSDLENLLDSIPARKKLLLIDACHSGEADPDEIEGGIVTTGMTYAAPKATSNNNKNDKSSVEIIDVKSDSINDSRKAFNIFGIMKNAFVDLRKNNGAFVIAASQSDQQAQENRELANGVFTRCMLDEIKNGSALNVSGLLKKINDCVSKNATGQDPANRQEPAESDWLLW
jgi:WD40 repeat protein